MKASKSKWEIAINVAGLGLSSHMRGIMGPQNVQMYAQKLGVKLRLIPLAGWSEQNIRYIQKHNVIGIAQPFGYSGVPGILFGKNEEKSQKLVKTMIARFESFLSTWEPVSYRGNDRHEYHPEGMKFDLLKELQHPVELDLCHLRRPWWSTGKDPLTQDEADAIKHLEKCLKELNVLAIHWQPYRDKTIFYSWRGLKEIYNFIRGNPNFLSEALKVIKENAAHPMPIIIELHPIFAWNLKIGSWIYKKIIEGIRRDLS